MRKDDPLNAWAHKTVLKHPSPTSSKLTGKTIVVKDNVSVAGAPLGLGTSAELFEGGKHAVSTIDAPVVKRILEAGGTIVGTAVCENFSMFALSITAETGPVHNAWAKGYATGGSTSGGAVLISAKDVNEWKKQGRRLPFPADEDIGEGVDMAVGGDQGGSIRMPSSFSGIYGLKPTHGLCPYTGIASLHPIIDHTGPMARSIEDTALLLEVMAGYDGIDFRQTPETPLLGAVPEYSALLSSWVAEKEKAGEWTPTSAGKGLRVGILKEAWEVLGLTPDVASLVRASAERFGELGAEVKEVSVPIHLLGASIWTVAGREMMTNSMFNGAPDLLSYTLPGLNPLKPGQDLFDKVAHRNPAVINVMMNTEHLKQKYGPAVTRKAHMHVHQLRAAYDEALKDLDVLVLPVTPFVAVKHPDGVTDSGSTLSVMETAKLQVGATLNTCPFNITGHPAMSIPCGWAPSKDGEGKLPVGMQLVGKRWHEMDVFKAATAWEVLGKGLDS